MQVQGVFVLVGNPERLWKKGSNEVKLYETLLVPFFRDTVFDGSAFILPAEAVALLACCRVKKKDDVMFDVLRSYLNIDFSDEEMSDLVNRFSGLPLSEFPEAIKKFKAKWSACRKNYRKTANITYDLTGLDGYLIEKKTASPGYRPFKVSATDGVNTCGVDMVMERRSNRQFTHSISVWVNGTLVILCQDANLYTSDEVLAVRRMKERLCRLLTDCKYGSTWTEFSPNVE